MSKKIDIFICICICIYDRQTIELCKIAVQICGMVLRNIAVKNHTY